jgi:uncharacterized protein (DUF2141 family)
MFLVIILFGMLASPVLLPDLKGEVSVVMTGLRNNDGVVWIILYNSPEGFLEKGYQGYRREKGLISQNKCSVTFNDLPYGDYAIAFIHDENSNQTMDHNKLKIPKEGFGVSNNPKFIFGAPKFEAAKFTLSKNHYELEVKTKYF